MKIISTASTEPVTLDEIKSHLVIAHNLDDSLLISYIKAAREWCEDFSNKSFTIKTYEVAFDKFPDSIFELPRPPLKEIVSLKYYTEDNEEHTINDYIVDTSSFVGRIALPNGFPAVRLRAINGFIVTFTAGYDIVPETAKHAIKLLVGHFYEHREETTERKLETIPMGVKSLLGINRNWVI